MSINYTLIQKNIDFILSHFEWQHELFPRTIMTSITRGQIKIDYESNVQICKDKIFDYFKDADFTDCKINAFPYATSHSIGIEVKNKTAASFMMIDLDLKDFKASKEKLDKLLKKTLDKLSSKFNRDARPTVLWTGNGYHIYQPLEGIVFEKEKTFYDFLPYVDHKDLTTEFLRFAEKYFTDGKADLNHRPSIKSCLLRVPGTLNSKNNEEVRIIQKWDRKLPAIQWITSDFRIHLIQKRIRKIKNGDNKIIRKNSSFTLLNKSSTQKEINWIEICFKHQ